MKLDVSLNEKSIDNLIKLEQLYALQLESLQQEVKLLKEQIENQNTASTLLEENELLIKQLHLVQEEFEAYVLKSKDIEKKLQNEVKQIKTDLAQIENQNTASTLSEENELLIKQLHLVQEEFEAYILKSKDIEKKLQNEVKQVKIDLEQFKQYYTNLANVLRPANGLITKIKRAFQPSIKLKGFMNDTLDIKKATDESTFITLSNSMISWLDFDVIPESKLDIYAYIKYQSIPEYIAKKSLMCFKYYDKADNYMSEVYGKAPYSNKFDSNFGYLKPSNEYAKIYSTLVPKGAAKLKIGFVAFNLYAIEKILMSDKIYLVKGS